MRCSKRTADRETDQTLMSCRASPTTPGTPENTAGEVKRLRRRTDISQERNNVKRKEKRGTEDDKGGEQIKCTLRKQTLAVLPHQWISLRRLQTLENSLALGREMLPASLSSYTPSRSGSQAHESRDQRRVLNLSFLPPIDKGLFVLLQDANLYCSVKAYTEAVSSLYTALQLTSKGLVLKDTQYADPEDINLVISYIQARLVVCCLRIKKPQLALEHAHRSIQLNPSHFQNHLRQAVVYRMLGKPCQAAKSVLTADWLYCLLGGTERHISTQLKLYWQVSRTDGHSVDECVCVCSTHLTAEILFRSHPNLYVSSSSDPRGGHVLPQTTELLSATDVSQHYLMTLGFRRKEEGLILKKIFSGIWPSLPGLCTTIYSLNRLYEKILPILDLMQATQINVSVYVGSGLIEGLQYGSLLVKLGHHREHNIILHRSQAQLATAPYLPQISMQQENTLVSSCTVFNAVPQVTDILSIMDSKKDYFSVIPNFKFGHISQYFTCICLEFVRRYLEI
uniref:Spermatosis associated 16 n=1 Tax=Dicentrarchus labrax TaxID=13489 RepID=A0A8C4EAM5_DICLA